MLCLSCGAAAPEADGTTVRHDTPVGSEGASRHHPAALALQANAESGSQTRISSVKHASVAVAASQAQQRVVLAFGISWQPRVVAPPAKAKQVGLQTCRCSHMVSLADDCHEQLNCERCTRACMAPCFSVCRGGAGGGSVLTMGKPWRRRWDLRARWRRHGPPHPQLRWGQHQCLSSRLEPPPISCRRLACRALHSHEIRSSL